MNLFLIIAAAILSTKGFEYLCIHLYIRYKTMQQLKKYNVEQNALLNDYLVKKAEVEKNDYKSH